MYIIKTIFSRTKEIKIGKIGTNRKSFEYLSKIAEDIKNDNPSKIKIDFSDCSFFEANMASPLYSVLSTYSKKGAISCINIRESIRKVFMCNHFSEQLGLNDVMNETTTMLPFRIFDLCEESAAEFFVYLQSYFCGKGLPKMTEILTKKIHQSVLELLINALSHSFSENGVFTCGQYYPNKRRLDFTISDGGVGIKQNVVNYTGKPMTATQAIKWALEAGNTTRTNGTPGGLGLDLLKEFITLNGGKLQIVSSKGYYEYIRGYEKNKKTNDMNYEFPGTSINIEINAMDKNIYDLKS